MLTTSTGPFAWLREALVIGDYPTRGWKFRALVVLVVVIGLIGVALMFTVGGVTKE